MICCAAGLLPAQIDDMSFEDTQFVVAGHLERNYHQQQQTRMIMYMTMCTVTKPEDRGDLYDLFHIPGDPDPEERKKKLADQYNAMVNANNELMESLRREKIKP